MAHLHGFKGMEENHPSKKVGRGVDTTAAVLAIKLVSTLVSRTVNVASPLCFNHRIPWRGIRWQFPYLFGKVSISVETRTLSTSLTTTTDVSDRQESLEDSSNTFTGKETGLSKGMRSQKGAS
jgi:hypothetical protein